MAKLPAAMRKIRMKQGSIDFDLDEARISLDASGKPTDVSAGAGSRREDDRRIYDWRANNSVAEESFGKEIPFLFTVFMKRRIPIKMRAQHISSNFGYRLHGAITNKMLQEVLIDCEGGERRPLLTKSLCDL